ncbi:MAG TPA: type IV secretion system DNA-binding domain-containing protein [Steroidobacteraceae bacterium]|nr:type IV secretion system DNA-binding domain-containing protein [Steroidobacteraceae bacterium]
MLETLTHGWSGLAFAYGTVQAPMLFTAIRRHAPLGKLLRCPILAVPATVAAGVADSAVSTMLHGWGAVSGGLLELIAGIGVYAGLGYVCGRVLARDTSGATHQRGSLVADSEESSSGRRQRAREGLRDHVASREAAVTLAGLKVPFADETKHFKFIGTTGTGKSTAICEVLGGALRRGDRAVIADPDGGYLRRFYDARRGDVILNPFDSRSAKWDLYGEITNDYDVEQLARSLIPDQDGGERSWRAYARTFLSAVVRQTRSGEIRDVRELYRVIVTAPTRELKVLVAGTPAQPFLDEHNTRMFDSIRSVTSSAVGALAYVGEQTGPPLAVRDWVNRGRGVLFIPYRAGQIAALRSTISAWVRLAIFETMNRSEGDRRTWFVVDELDALGQIDGLKDALARLRKFGGRCVLGFQSIAQVSGTYGHAEAQTLVENCGNTLILRCSASENGGTSNFASQLIGKREVMRTSESRSRRAFELRSVVTRSQHLAVESAVLDSEIEQLPDLRGYLKLASDPRWRRVRLAPPSAAATDEPTRRARVPERAGATRDPDSSAHFEP